MSSLRASVSSTALGQVFANLVTDDDIRQLAVDSVDAALMQIHALSTVKNAGTTAPAQVNLLDAQVHLQPIQPTMQESFLPQKRTSSYNRNDKHASASPPQAYRQKLAHHHKAGCATRSDT